MYDVLLVLFIHSGFLPETLGRHTLTVYKKWNIAADMFCFFNSPHAFWVSLFKQGPASKLDAAGSACRGRLFAPGSQILSIDGPFLVLKIGATAGPLSPIVWRDTEGNKVFFWGVICCLLWNGSLLRLFCSSVPLVATADARFVNVHSPARIRISARAWAGGRSWAECIGMQSEGQRRRKSRSQSHRPSGDVCSRRLQLVCRETA